jgi:hypothetical protein
MGQATIESLQRKAQSERRAGRFDAAAERLIEAIRIAAASLADLHGTLGGTFREQRRLAEAVNEYDRGYRIDQRYGIVSSYNALNRLLTRLMADTPASAGTTKIKVRIQDRINVKAELRRLQEELTRRLRASDVEYWAAGDLAVVAALNGDSRVMKRALKVFMTPSTPRFAYETYLKMVRMLLVGKRQRNPALRALQDALLTRAG